MEKTISEKNKDSDPPFLAPPAKRDLTARKHWGQAALKKYYARSTVYINSVYPTSFLVGLSLITV